MSNWQQFATPTLVHLRDDALEQMAQAKERGERTHTLEMIARIYDDALARRIARTQVGDLLVIADVDDLEVA